MRLIGPAAHIASSICNFGQEGLEFRIYLNRSLILEGEHPPLRLGLEC
jgi:hypothetical protein